MLFFAFIIILLSILVQSQDTEEKNLLIPNYQNKSRVSRSIVSHDGEVRVIDPSHQQEDNRETENPNNTEREIARREILNKKRCKI